MAEPRVPYSLNVMESCSSCALNEKGLFCKLPQGTIAEMNSLRQFSLYPRGTVLFVEGEAPRGLFILCSGQAKLSVTSATGHAINLRIVEQGEALGLSSVVANEPYVMRAETLSPCQVSFIPRLQFLQLFRAHPDLSLVVSKHLSMELHKAYDQTRLLALAPGTQVKVAQFLLSWADKHGELVTEGVRLAIHMTHEEIGESIGASRETVSRVLGDFKRKQLIRTRGGTIVILQPQQLRGLTTDGSH
jgi:CRP/FNR family transcriptional regulator, cyclic AMP receptor protein